MRSCLNSWSQQEIIFAQCGVSVSRAITAIAAQFVISSRYSITVSLTSSNFAPERISRSISDMASSAEICCPRRSAMSLNASPSHSNSSLDRMRTRDSRLPSEICRTALLSCCSGTRLLPISEKLSTPTNMTTSRRAGTNIRRKSALDCSAYDFD